MRGRVCPLTDGRASKRQEKGDEGEESMSEGGVATGERDAEGVPRADAANGIESLMLRGAGPAGPRVEELSLHPLSAAATVLEGSHRTSHSGCVCVCVAASCREEREGKGRAVGAWRRGKVYAGVAGLTRTSSKVTASGVWPGRPGEPSRGVKDSLTTNEQLDLLSRECVCVLGGGRP